MLRSLGVVLALLIALVPLVRGAGALCCGGSADATQRACCSPQVSETTGERACCGGDHVIGIERHDTEAVDGLEAAACHCDHRLPMAVAAPAVEPAEVVAAGLEIAVPSATPPALVSVDGLALVTRWRPGPPDRMPSAAPVAPYLVFERLLL